RRIVNLLIGVLIVLLPVPLLAIIVRSGHYRYCVGPAIAVGSVWVFNCLGAPVVMARPEIATERYAALMLLVIVLLYLTYAVLFGLGRRVLVTYETIRADESLREAMPLFLLVWGWAV